jgi:hypothetical protein
MKETDLKRLQLSVRWLVLFILAALALLAGCAAQPPAPVPGGRDLDPALLHGGYVKPWKMTQYSVKGVMAPVPDWAADNLLVINANGTGAWVYGEVARVAGETLKHDDFDWQLLGNALATRGHHPASGQGSYQITITGLTAGEMVLERAVPATASAPAETLRFVMKPAVTPASGTSERHRLLTSGLAKWWVPMERREGGQAVALSPGLLENYLLLCADGTGCDILGGSERNTSDPAKNDFFSWSLADNDSVFRVQEGAGPVPTKASDRKIIRLEDSLLVLEGKQVVNGRETLVSVTWVPLFPRPR